MKAGSSAVIRTIVVLVLLLFYASFSSWAGSSPGDNGESSASLEAFINAYERGDFAGIVEMVNNGLDLHQRDMNGRTALNYVAAHDGNGVFAARVSELLVARGAEINVEDSFGRLPIIYAVEAKNGSMVEMLLTNGADCALLCRAYNTPVIFVPFWRQDPASAGLVSSRCRNVNLTDSIGNTPLSWAARLGYLDVVKTLLKRGAKADNTSKFGKTPLMEAAERGRFDIAELLVREGADVNRQTKKGWTPLMWAAEKGYTPIVALLIEAKAKLFVKNNQGERALIIARKNNREETAEIIQAAEYKFLLKIAGGVAAIALVLAVITVFLFKRK